MKINTVVITSEKSFSQLVEAGFDETRHLERRNVRNLHKLALALERAGYGRYESGGNVMLSMFYSPHGFFALGAHSFILLECIQEVEIPMRRAATVPRGVYQTIREMAEAHGVSMQLHKYNGWSKPLILLE